MRFLNNLFPKNDWMTIWAESATWNVNRNQTGSGIEYAFYEIQYSKSRDRYRLETSGLVPKEHAFYKEALTELAKMNKKVLCKDEN